MASALFFYEMATKGRADRAEMQQTLASSYLLPTITTKRATPFRRYLGALTLPFPEVTFVFRKEFAR